MKTKLFFFYLLISCHLFSQNITLDDIWTQYSFYSKQEHDLKWYNSHYIIEYTGESFIQSDVLANEEAQTIITVQQLSKLLKLASKNYNIENTRVSNFSIGPNESHLIIELNSESIYRHSYKSHVLIWDLKNENGTTIPVKEKVLYPTISPNSTYLTFIQNNNIYNYSLKDKDVNQITFDGEKNKIINGMSDWLYEEEFGLQKAYEWTIDEKTLYYLQFDESQVPTKSILNVDQSIYSYKYPRVGEDFSTVDLYAFDLNSRVNTIWQDFPKDTYVPRLFIKNGLPLTISLNRSQNKLDFKHFSSSKKNKSIYQEKNDTYIELPTCFINDSSVIFTSEKSGFNQLYIIKNKGLEKQLTSEEPITQVFDVSNRGIYYSKSSFPKDNQFVFRVDYYGKERVIANKKGHNAIEVSSNGKYLFLTHSTRISAPSQTFLDSEGGAISLLNDNQIINNRIDQIDLPKIKNGLFENNRGDSLAYLLLTPSDFDSSKSYPLVIHTYGGPGYQLIKNKYDPFNFFWHSMLIQKGFIIAIIDPTGSGGQGKGFKDKTYKNLGENESNDIIDFATYLSDKNWCNENKIGFWGWSYGGYLSSKVMMKSDIINTCIAIAPVTDWTLYDCAYTERYQGLLDANSENYLNSSCLNYTDDIKGNFLLIHGTADDNVHVENSYQLQNHLIELDQSFDTFYYPGRNHGIYGGNTRYHLFEMMTNYFLKHLK